MKPFKIAITGHVDHGKSTLIGKILKESDQVYLDRQKKVENICQSKGMKFEYAFLLDAFEEEQKQGITIDKLEIPWKYNDQRFIFIDTPGHKEFIKNMFSGSTNADMALVMIDALEGIQEQTKQHLKILNLLGIQKIIIVVNKMDKIAFSETVYTEIESEILKYSSNFNFATFQVTPISAYDGDNLFTSSKNLNWYKGKTLINAIIELSKIPSKKQSKNRISIQDIYKFEDTRIYAGIVLSGKIKIGDSIKFALSNSDSQITTFESWGNTPSKQEYTEGDILSFTLKDPLFLPKGEIGYTNQDKPIINHTICGSVFWFSTTPPDTNQNYYLKIANQKHNVKIMNYKELGSSIFELTILSETAIAFDVYSTSMSLGRFVLFKDFTLCAAGINSATEQNTEIKKLKNTPFVFWLTGLSGAGKTTIAKEVALLLKSRGIHSIILDGDELREGLNNDLDFSNESRTEQTRRTAEIAKILCKQNTPVIVSLISPIASARDEARKTLKDFNFIEVFVDAPINVCQERDPKGLYKLANSGSIRQFTGRDSTYESPKSPEIILDNDKNSAKNNAQLLFDYIDQHVKI